MKRKRVLASILTGIMLAAISTCVGAEGETEEYVATEYTNEIPEDVLNGFGKFNMDATDVNRVFSCIETSVHEYFEEYEINPKEFVWPEYKRDGLTEVDEDNSWMYLNIIWANYSSENEERYCTDGYEYALPSEEHTELMHAILDGMISWAEEYQKEEEPPTEILVYRVGERMLSPFGEKLPEIIVFSQE